MAAPNPRSLLKDVLAGKFKSAYYFYGAEDYRITEAEKYIAGQFLPSKQMMTNYRRLDGRKTSMTDLLAELSVYPMLGERQVFAISDIQSFKPTELNRIYKMLQPPDPNRVIIFSTPSSKAPRKSAAIIKNMTASGVEVVEFNRLEPREAAQTMQRKLSQAGFEIDPEALSLFTELVAGNRGALEAETDKLINFKEGLDQKITVDDVTRVCSGFEVFNVFELGNELATGDKRRILRHVNQLLSSGDITGTVLWHLGNHFVLLYLLKEGKQLPANKRWLAWRLKDQANRYSSEQLRTAIIRVAEMTAAIRRDQLDPRMSLESLVLELAGAGR